MEIIQKLNKNNIINIQDKINSKEIIVYMIKSESQQYL